MSNLYVLYEHAAGYALFQVSEFEEIGALLPQVEAAVIDFGKFSQIVKPVSFKPFKNAIAALENVNSISEGICPEDLQVFLEAQFKGMKVKKLTIGVAEPKLGAAITEALAISCNHVGPVPEILRGIRTHFHKLVDGFTLQSCGIAQLGLGHSYSRAKVKFNVNRVDNMIIQSIALLDQLDKDVNTFSMRIREWYSYHFPELYKIVPENYLYARVAKFVGNRKTFDAEKLEALEEVVMDSAKAQAILDASRSSMGMDISPVDLLNIEMFATRVIALSDYRKSLGTYLHKKMGVVAPNLAALIGDQVGARLISHAGSLTNLAKYPASTVQILGAEKALFRALKTKTNTPKYGLLFHSTFIGRAGQTNKGRISRYLANKCSIASRIDCFADAQSSVFGEKLKQQVEDRLKFYETGDKPAKNIDVMKEAMEEHNVLAASLGSESAKKKKKKKKVGKSISFTQRRTKYLTYYYYLYTQSITCGM
uniref:Nucleolar protein 56 n=2 Tax=Cacopsylla melanoneura TaxID=428564 RepID=A0A8D8Y2Y2_9HEMI